ncbi:serine hydrolase [uncultured Psychroserpens sp.]|uniref:serine hydrolase domain-containing protein n=1 Tax=uncultured Psychroserpens sp. TaxID=255436 RepID=UPI0026248EE3|nr:serine hydrolase domain-containing protein [uncultured Psychroserpens sp.]
MNNPFRKLIKCRQYLKSLVLLGFIVMISCDNSSNKINKINELIDNYSNAKILNGELYIKLSDTAFFKKVGYYDYDSNILHRQVSTNSKFNIASLTKLFTATCILKLYQDGKVELDEKLSSCIHDLRGKWSDSVSIRQLLNHTSGLPREFPRDMKKINFDADGMAYNSLLTKSDSIQTRFKPGSRISYSNIAYWYLGMLIEKQMKMPYIDAVRLILNRNGDSFNELTISNDQSIKNHFISGNNIETRNSALDTKSRYASGGISTDINTIKELIETIYDDSFIASETRSLFFSDFGFKKQQSNKMFAGYLPGYRNMIWMNDKQEFIITLNNSDGPTPILQNTQIAINNLSSVVMGNKKEISDFEALDDYSQISLNPGNFKYKDLIVWDNNESLQSVSFGSAVEKRVFEIVRDENGFISQELGNVSIYGYKVFNDSVLVVLRGNGSTECRIVFNSNPEIPHELEKNETVRITNIGRK